MVNDLKTGLKLYRYGQGARGTLYLFYLVLLMDVVVNALTSNNPIMDFCMILSGLFLYQMVLSLDVSEMVQNTLLRKKLQTTIPMTISYAMSLFSFVFIILVKLLSVLIFKRSHDSDIRYFCLFVVFIMILQALISLLYKTFEVAITVIMLGAFGLGTGIPMLGENVSSSIDAVLDGMGLSVLPCIIIAFASIFISAIINLKLSEALYKREISKNVFTSTYKRME